MSGPLSGFEFKFLDFKGLSGESDEWISFDRTTVIVGRNNVGKSALIHALAFAADLKHAFNAEWHRHGRDARYQLRQQLGEMELKRAFPENTSGGAIGGNHWAWGRNLIGQVVEREVDSQRNQKWIRYPEQFTKLGSSSNHLLTELLKIVPAPAVKVFGIAAERNVVPEPATPPSPVRPSGTGLTNLIRAFLYDSSLKMEEVESGLLSDLNWVFASDTKFSRIVCRQDQSNDWEIFLGGDNGGMVRLSQSGSSLKSIFIMLAAVRLNPLIDRSQDISNSVFYVEEPENNLHPALLRRLLDYLDRIARERDCNLILTTHSPTAIDWASRRDEVSLFHVRKAAGGALVSKVEEYGATRRLLDDLDVRASELLQANGVIWVEGPTERIYLRKWIEAVSDGELLEGQHYSVMFYGGRLLSHLSCADPGGHTRFIHLLRMNRNLAVMIDSDKRTSRSPINETKKRVIAEVEETGGFVWVTSGKEIENYISDRLVNIVAPSALPVDRFASVPDALGMSDKIKLAEAVIDNFEDSDLDTLDLREKITVLCDHIHSWNATTS